MPGTRLYPGGDVQGDPHNILDEMIAHMRPEITLSPVSTSSEIKALYHNTHKVR